MAAGDWTAGSKLVIDNIAAGYNDLAHPPTLSNVVITYRVQLPSGGFTNQRTNVFNTAGMTAANIIAQVAASFNGLTVGEGITP